MKIKSVHRIKGRGLCVTCKPTERPSPGSVIRHADGRAWLVTAVDVRWPWHSGESVGLFLRAKAEGQAEPIEGDDVDIIEPLTIMARVDELEREVATLRAECARLGAAACDAKWDLLP